MKLRFKRLITLICLIVMIFSSCNGIVVFAQDQMSVPYNVDEITTTDIGVPVNDSEAMHFIIRHWHSQTIEENLNEQIIESANRFFVVAEGFIYPVGSTYVITQVQEDEYGITHEVVLSEDSVDGDGYIQSIDTHEGTITLKANPIENAEHFSSFSVSAGHDAVEYGDDEITITYDPYVHLVKAHVFYIKDTVEVMGTDSEIVFGSNETVSGSEIDSTNAYAYLKAIGDNREGDYVVDNDGNIITDEKKLPYSLVLGEDIEEVKVYNTQEGLHTDKTATVVEEDENNRTFNIDLEAWYTEGDSAKVGMILDASGSMVGASEQLMPINVSENPSLISKVGAIKNSDNWNDIFLTPEEIAQVLNKNNTDNSTLGESGYSYFVYDDELYPLAYWEGSSESKEASTAYTKDKAALGSVYSSNNEEGWYFLSHGGDWPSPGAAGNNKRLYGLPNEATFTDQARVPYYLNSEVLDTGNTNKKYTPTTSNSATKFYIDENGYLRAFYFAAAKWNSDTPDQARTSYVYEMSDSGYVKVESLQRALGSFVTELKETSSGSEVSAVRFSTSKIVDKDLGQLVLLDWTNNVAESTQILSLTRGNGSFLGFNEGRIKEYNYGLTGSTSTVKGLKSFKENLAEEGQDVDRNYIVIFTDGKDTDLSTLMKNNPNDWPAWSDDSEAYATAFNNALAKAKQNNNLEALKIADELKDKGYTIFTVMLAAGTVSEGTKDYTDAMLFLSQLSGYKGMQEAERENYYFSTVTAEADKKAQIREELLALNGTVTEAEVNAAFEALNIKTEDLLTEIFSEEILDTIVEPLEGYTVQDYIDPRFNLVDKNGMVYELGTGGTVTYGENTTTVTDNQSVTVEISEVSNPSARKAQLYFNPEKEMYYLKWIGQTIPLSEIGSTRLPIWNARITVQAKDDFIGGNTVLTNGTESDMNYVFSPKGSNNSSGADRSVKTAEGDLPSKGFPRTTVNVGTVYEEALDGQVIYMGEELNASTIAKELITLAQDQISSSRYSKYYFEYIQRYAKAQGKTLDEILENLVEDGALTLEYSYLRDIDSTTDIYAQDSMGQITYEIKSVDSEYPEDITTDTNSRKSLLTVRFDALSEADREENVKDLVSDTDYEWNKDYKPSEGTEIGEEQLIESSYNTDIVSGEVVLQLEVSESVKALLKDKIDLRAKLINDKAEVAGVYTLTYTQEKGGVVDFSLESDYNKYGLPMGEYTVVLDTANTKLPEGVTLGEVKVVTETKDYLADSFKVAAGNERPQDYMASFSGNTVKLGTGSDKVYTDQRFGLYRVALTTDKDTVPGNPEKPGEEKPGVEVKEPTLIKEQSVNGSTSSTGVLSVQNGDVVTYYLTVKNTTNVTMTNVVVTDRIPQGVVWIKDQTAPGYHYNGEKGTLSWTFESIEAGKSVTVWFSAHVRSEGAAMVTNQFTTDFKENPKDKPAESNKVVLEVLEDEKTGGPNLVLRKLQQVQRNNSVGYAESTDGQITDQYIEVREGDQVTYYITVENTGDETAYDVVISDPVPEGLTFIKGSENYSEVFKQDGNKLVWTIGTLEPGKSAQVQVTFKVIVPEITEEIYWRNVAYVNFGGTDILTPSNEVVIGDPPTETDKPGFDGDNMTPDSVPEIPDSTITPDDTVTEESVGSTETTVEPAVNKTTTTTTNVTQTGVSPQTGVTVTVGLFVLVLLTAVVILILMFLDNRRRKNNDRK